MMLRMRESPGMERDQKEGVDDEPGGMVERFALAKSAMSAFVSQLPKTSEDESLNESIGEPSNVTQMRERDAGDLSGRQP